MQVTKLIGAGAVTPLLQTSINSVGQPIVYPKGIPEVSAFLVEMAPGERTPWHHHPAPLLGYILAGEITVRLDNGEHRIVRAGEVSLEAVDTIHYGINEGTVPVKIIVFAVGEKDLPVTINDNKPL